MNEDNNSLVLGHGVISLLFILQVWGLFPMQARLATLPVFYQRYGRAATSALRIYDLIRFLPGL